MSEIKKDTNINLKTLMLITIFLGWFGGHRFYCKQKHAVLMLVVGIISIFFLMLPSLIWLLIDIYKMQKWDCVKKEVDNYNIEKKENRRLKKIRNVEIDNSNLREQEIQKEKVKEITRTKEIQNNIQKQKLEEEKLKKQAIKAEQRKTKETQREKVKEIIKTREEHQNSAMNFEIHAGDFNTGKKAGSLNGSFLYLSLKSSPSMLMHKFDINTISDLSIASEQNIKKIGGTVGWGVAGELLLGPVGMVAGLILGGKDKKIRFVLKFNDGKKMLATTNKKTYEKMEELRF